MSQSLREKIEKILFMEYVGTYEYCPICGNPMSQEKRKLLTDAILQKIEESLPEKQKFVEPDEPIEDSCFKDGFNICLSEIREKLK